VAVDASGNVFVAEGGNNAVQEIVAVNDSPQTVTLLNAGDASLTISAISYPGDFPGAGGDGNACTDSTSLSTGESCDLPIEFLPEETGAFSDSQLRPANPLGGGYAGTADSAGGLTLSRVAHFVRDESGRVGTRSSSESNTSSNPSQILIQPS